MAFRRPPPPLSDGPQRGRRIREPGRPFKPGQRQTAGGTPLVGGESPPDPDPDAAIGERTRFIAPRQTTRAWGGSFFPFEEDALGPVQTARWRVKHAAMHRSGAPWERPNARRSIPHQRREPDTPRERPSAGATLVERSTRYVKIVRLTDGIKAGAVRAALTDAPAAIPPE